MAKSRISRRGYEQDGKDHKIPQVNGKGLHVFSVSLQWYQDDTCRQVIAVTGRALGRSVSANGMEKMETKSPMWFKKVQIRQQNVLLLLLSLWLLLSSLLLLLLQANYQSGDFFLYTHGNVPIDHLKVTLFHAPLCIFFQRPQDMIRMLKQEQIGADRKFQWCKAELRSSKEKSETLEQSAQDQMDMDKQRRNEGYPRKLNILNWFSRFLDTFLNIRNLWNPMCWQDLTKIMDEASAHVINAKRACNQNRNGATECVRLISIHVWCPIPRFLT